LAETLGIPAEVRPVKVAEIKEAHANGSLKEIFGAGTAAVISPISAFSHGEVTYDLPQMEDSFASMFKSKLMDIQYNRSEDPFGWRYRVV
jgi:branched-chain amino acid aminotransferase